MKRTVELLLILMVVMAGFGLLYLSDNPVDVHPTKRVYHLKWCEPIPVGKIRRPGEMDI